MGACYKLQSNQQFHTERAYASPCFKEQILQHVFFYRAMLPPGA